MPRRRKKIKMDDYDDTEIKEDVPLINEKDTIQFYSEESSDYGNKSREPVELDEYFKMFLRDPELSLYASCSIGSYYVPMADIDEEENAILLTMWLQEQRIKFVSIESNPGHFWIFIDRVTDDVDEFLQLMNVLPAIDSSYLNFVLKHKCPFVRTCFKDQELFVPHIVSNDVDSEIVLSFTKQLVDHFQDERLTWCWRYKKYKHGDVDLSNPKWGKPLGVTLADILQT